MPGWREESLGYHTDDGKIYYNDDYSGRETKGLFNSLNGFKNICHWLLEAVCSAYETNEKWITFEIFWYPPKLGLENSWNWAEGVNFSERQELPIEFITKKEIISYIHVIGAV